MAMQWLHRTQLPFRSSSILQQSFKYHRPSRHSQSRAKGENFFLSKPVHRPFRPSQVQTFFRRRYANATRDRIAGYNSSRKVMWTVIGLNTAVFGAWQYGIAQKDRKLINIMTRDFTLSLQGVKEGRYYTLLTSAFSQQMLPHFVFNMFAFHAFGSIIAFMGVGGLQLATLCIGSAVTGSIGFLYHWQNQPSGNAKLFSRGLGASGMVMGLGAAATCLAPFAPMQLMFIPINIPLWVITIGYAAVDTYYLHSSSPVGHSAHLGGSAFGVLFYFAYLRRFGGIWKMLGRVR